MTQTGLAPKLKIFSLVPEDELGDVFNKWAEKNDEIFRITLATPIRTVDNMITLAVFYDVLEGVELKKKRRQSRRSRGTRP